MGFEVINEIKKANKWTNEDIASMSGIPKPTIDKITSGITTNPNFDTVWALAEALGCTVDVFKENKDSKIQSVHFHSPTAIRITEKLPKLTEDQLESIEKRIDVYIDDNEVSARKVMAQQEKKAT